MFLRRPRRESDEVVHDDVNRAAHGVGAEVGEVERFRPNSLPGKSRVAMHDDGNNFAESLARTVQTGSAHATARLFRAPAARRGRTYRLPTTPRRHQVDD